MNIRFATEGDKGFIISEGIKFLEYHPLKIPIDLSYLQHLANILIKDHVVLIAEDGENRVGMIAGTITPNLFNPNYIVLQELFWWVVERYRDTSAALRLLAEFEKVALSLNITAISMVTTVYTPSLEKLYKKRGYVPVESFFVKEF